MQRTIKMNKLLENNRIRLRAPEPEDLEVLYEWENDTDLWMLGAAVAPYSRYTLKQYLIESRHDIYADKQLRLMVELKQERKTIGTVDLYDFDPFHRRAGVGILIGRQHRKQGLGLQTLELLETYAFDFLNLHQLYAWVPVKNSASIGLFQKAGYLTVGRMSDWISTGHTFETVHFFQKINHLSTIPAL